MTPERYEQIIKGEFDMDQFFKETSAPFDPTVYLSDDRLSN